MSTAYYRVREWAGKIIIEGSPSEGVHIQCTHGPVRCPEDVDVWTTRKVIPDLLLVMADRDAGAVMWHVGGESSHIFLATRGDDLPADMQVISEHGELFTVAQVRAMTDQKERAE